MTTERAVLVWDWDEPQTIRVHQKSKSVWIAHGEYMGQIIEVKESNPTAAEKAWVEAARYRCPSPDSGKAKL